MELNLSQSTKQAISAIILIILPWIIMATGFFGGIKAVAFYVPLILWFGIGTIFYEALY